MMDQRVPINYHSPGTAVLYNPQLTPVHVFKVLESSIYENRAILTVTEDVVPEKDITQFIYYGSDGVIFIGNVASVESAGTGTCIIYVKFKKTDSGHTLAIAEPEKKAVYVTNLAAEIM